MREFDVVVQDMGADDDILTGLRLIGRKVISKTGATEEPDTEEFMFGASILEENGINPAELSPGDTIRFSVTDGEGMGGAADEDGLVLFAQVIRDDN